MLCAVSALFLVIPAPSFAPQSRANPRAIPATALAFDAPLAGLPPTITLPAEANILHGKRVALQIGHWRAADLPDEQAHLRGNGGAEHNGVTEIELNTALAYIVADELTALGVTVDVLPAPVPIGYTADAFVSIHCDYASNIYLRGYKVGVPWRASAASLALRDALHESFAATDQPFHNGVNSTMRGYYAFNYLHYDHAIAPTTPAVIIEAGFMTNPADYLLLSVERQTTAHTIASGISQFLAQPRSSAETQPPTFPLLTPLFPLDALIDPDAAAAPVQTLQPGELLWSYAEQDGWYHVVLPPEWDYIGWVRATDVAPLPDGAWKNR